MSRTVVAVVDIGSNTIKSLAASRGPHGSLTELHTGASDTRISEGLGRTPPRLTEDGMRRGVAAVRHLLTEMAPLEPQPTILVATSAVRSAANGAEFRRRIRAATGTPLRVLSGTEEAELIGRGLRSDPALSGLRDFYVFDLGGGSLECLAFRGGRLAQALSLPLGCVRLTESCVSDPRAPFSAADRGRVTHLCQETLTRSGFRFDLAAGADAVFTGGTLTTTRAVFAHRGGRSVDDANPVIPIAAVSMLLEETALLPLASRQQIPGLPPARADVFPTALTTVLAVADAGGFPEFRHSFRNLRYGVAAEALEL